MTGSIFIMQIARNSSFFKIKHKIDFTKKLFNYENTGRKKEAGKNILKSRLSNKFALRWLSLSKPPHLV